MNLLACLFYPIIVSWWIQSHPVAGTYLMIFSTGLLLKLISYHHVMHDNRKLIKELAKDEKFKPGVNTTGMSEEMF